MVSIPFKRESVSKVPFDKIPFTYQISFNSLQTGKRIQRNSDEWNDRMKREWCFNSLQTGKRIQSPGKHLIAVSMTTVSIPFKRESVSKGRNNKKTTEEKKVSIPFKRESVSKVRRKR